LESGSMKKRKKRWTLKNLPHIKTGEETITKTKGGEGKEGCTKGTK